MADLPEEPPGDPGGPGREAVLSVRVDDLPFSVRTANVLACARITRVGQLVELTEADLMRARNFGRKSLVEVTAVLRALGLGLRPPTPWDRAAGAPPGMAGVVSNPDEIRQLCAACLPTTALELSARAHNGLVNARIEYLFQLTARTEPELLRFQLLGRKTVDEICERLAAFGLQLGKPLPVDLSACGGVEEARSLLHQRIRDLGGEPSPRLPPHQPLVTLPAGLLDLPWDEHLDLSRQTRSLLRHAGLLTLRDIIDQPDGIVPRTRYSTGGPQREQRRALAALAERFGNPAARRCVDDLEARRLRDEPATVLGRGFRDAVASLEAEHGPQTLGTLALLLPRLAADPASDPGRVARCVDALRRLAAGGFAAVPSDLAALLRLMLADPVRDERGVIELRYVQGLSLAVIGHAVGVSRERVRQIVQRDVHALRRRWGLHARAIVHPLVTALDAAAGLLRCEDVAETLNGVAPLGAALALHVAGHEDVVVTEGFASFHRVVDTGGRGITVRGPVAAARLPHGTPGEDATRPARRSP